MTSNTSKFLRGFSIIGGLSILIVGALMLTWKDLCTRESLIAVNNELDAAMSSPSSADRYAVVEAIHCQGKLKAATEVKLFSRGELESTIWQKLQNIAVRGREQTVEGGDTVMINQLVDIPKLTWTSRRALTIDSKKGLAVVRRHPRVQGVTITYLEDGEAIKSKEPGAMRPWQRGEPRQPSSGDDQSSSQSQE